MKQEDFIKFLIKKTVDGEVLWENEAPWVFVTDIKSVDKHDGNSTTRIIMDLEDQGSSHLKITSHKINSTYKIDTTKVFVVVFKDSDLGEDLYSVVKDQCRLNNEAWFDSIAATIKK